MDFKMHHLGMMGVFVILVWRLFQGDVRVKTYQVAVKRCLLFDVCIIFLGKAWEEFYHRKEGSNQDLEEGDLTLSMNRCVSDICLRRGHAFRE